MPTPSSNPEPARPPSSGAAPSPGAPGPADAGRAGAALPPDPSPADARTRQVRQWVADLAPAQALAPGSLRPASSDASFRRYFRIDRAGAAGSTAIVMDAPPERENCEAWMRMQELLAQAGLHVPRILAADPDQGLLLIEDLGSFSLWDAVQPGQGEAAIEERMRGALATLLRMQSIAIAGPQARPAALGLGAYDEARLRMELGLFSDWYAVRECGAVLGAPEQAVLEDATRKLIATFLGQERVLTHRDFHSRNLMVCAAPGGDGASPGFEFEHGLLDFQDAVHGPASYDLVSLLRDAYLDWPADRQIDWAARYWDGARRLGIPVNGDFGAFWRELEWTGLERSLKILGIFARLAHRDGKTAYRAYIPRVREQAWDVAQRYDALAPLARLLDRLSGTERASGFHF